jgi:hypothetical protein
LLTGSIVWTCLIAVCRILFIKFQAGWPDWPVFLFLPKCFKNWPIPLLYFSLKDNLAQNKV